MMVDRLINWNRYFSGEAWKLAFSFLEDLSPNAEESDFIAIRGEDIFARIMSYETRPPEEGLLEAHDQYIDIQMSLVGSEGIDCFPRGMLDISVPYDEEKDFLLFHRNREPLARVLNAPGFFTVLFSDDAHMAQMMTGDNRETVKKVVVKLRASILEPRD